MKLFRFFLVAVLFCCNILYAGQRTFVVDGKQLAEHESDDIIKKREVGLNNIANLLADFPESIYSIKLSEQVFIAEDGIMNIPLKFALDEDKYYKTINEFDKILSESAVFCFELDDLVVMLPESQRHDVYKFEALQKMSSQLYDGFNAFEKNIKYKPYGFIAVNKPAVKKWNCYVLPQEFMEEVQKCIFDTVITVELLSDNNTIVKTLKPVFDFTFFMYYNPSTPVYVKFSNLQKQLYFSPRFIGRGNSGGREFQSQENELVCRVEIPSNEIDMIKSLKVRIEKYIGGGHILHKDATQPPIERHGKMIKVMSPYS